MSAARRSMVGITTMARAAAGIPAVKSRRARLRGGSSMVTSQLTQAIAHWLAASATTSAVASSGSSSSGRSSQPLVHGSHHHTTTPTASRVSAAIPPR